MVLTGDFGLSVNGTALVRIGIVGRVVRVYGAAAFVLLLLGPAVRRTQALPGVTVGRAVAHRTFVGEIKVPRFRMGRGGRAHLPVQPRPGLLLIGGRPEQYASHRQQSGFAVNRHDGHRSRVDDVVIDIVFIVVIVVVVIIVYVYVFRFGNQHAPAAAAAAAAATTATASVTGTVTVTVINIFAAATVSIGCLRNSHVDALVVVGDSIEEEHWVFIKHTHGRVQTRRIENGFLPVMPCRQRRRRTFWRALSAPVSRKSDDGFFF